MKRFLSALVLGAFVVLTPSCTKTDKAQEGVPAGFTKREIRDMKADPSAYDPSVLEKVGLDPSQGTPGGIGAPGNGAPGKAAEGGEAK